MKLTEDEYRRLVGSRRVPGAAAASPATRARSAGEAELERRLVEAGITGWRTEYEFAPGRKWRLDFAFPAQRLAVEVDGSVHRIKGRFSGDLDKHNALTLAGWRLVRFDAKRISSGNAVETIRAALAADQSRAEAQGGAG